MQDAKFRNLNYSYDANGRMYKTSTVSPANQSNAVYDASGQRVATQVDGVWTFFIYDTFGKKVCEYGGLQATDEGGVKYVLQDWQGSSRAILSNSGYVNARMDYTAFGEEINSGIGQRTTTQGYAASNTLDQKYALTERDKATGLDHTWFRKLENQAGRWTSPDPYNGSINLGSPQSFNRYSYVENQPTNFVDPSGLVLVICRTYDESTVDLATNTVTVRERRECEILFAGGGTSTNIFPQQPIDIGGGTGVEPGKVDDSCENARLVTVARDVSVTYGENAIRFFTPEFAKAFNQALRELNKQGIIPHINSAFRTEADQQRMRDGASGSNPAAKGVSLHQTGNAVDINGTWTEEFKTIRKIMEKYGFTWGGHWKKPNTDKPHFELNPYGQKGTKEYTKNKEAAAAAAAEYYANRTASCWSQ